MKREQLYEVSKNFLGPKIYYGIFLGREIPFQSSFFPTVPEFSVESFAFGEFNISRFLWKLFQEMSALFVLFYIFGILLFPVDRDTHDFYFFAVSRAMSWYIGMQHVETFFLCGVMTFSYSLMFLHNMFIFKTKAYRVFCLLWNSQHGCWRSADMAEDKILSVQIRSGSFRRKTPGKLSSWR